MSDLTEITGIYALLEVLKIEDYLMECLPRYSFPQKQPLLSDQNHRSLNKKHYYPKKKKSYMRWIESNIFFRGKILST